MDHPAREPFLISIRGHDVYTSGPTSAVFGSREREVTEGTWEGIGARWEWDGDRLHASNDRYGFYPLFYHASSTRFAIGNSIAELLARGVPAVLDDAAIAVFLRVGYLLGDRTPFKGIRAVPPGSKLTWHDGRLEVEREGLPPRWKEAPGREAAIRIYGEAFRGAVEDMLPLPGEQVAVPLSGGRDSRHILLALHRLGRPPDACITMRHFPPKPNEDAAVAQEVTSALNLPHVLLDPPERRLPAERKKNVLTHYCADEHAWILPLAGHLAQEGYSVAFDGIGGDVLSAGLSLSEERLRLYEAENLDPLADRLLEHEGYLPSMLPRDSHRRWNRELALEQVSRELESHRSAPNPVGQFFFWNRTRREIALSTWSILGESCSMLTPYLHPTVYSFLSSLPAEHFLDDTFHTETISHHYPDYAHLRYESPEAPRRLTPRSETASFLRDLLVQIKKTKSSFSHVRPGFLAPRMARALISREYGARAPTVFGRAIYLQQIQEAQSREASEVRWTRAPADPGPSGVR